jgi:hypothetical protein
MTRNFLGGTPDFVPSSEPFVEEHHVVVEHVGNNNSSYVKDDMDGRDLTINININIPANYHGSADILNAKSLIELAQDIYTRNCLSGE